MKKFIFVLFFVTTIVFGAFTQNGVIRDLTGDVELKPEGASTFVGAFVGDVIALNTIVSTGFRSTVTIMIGSSQITVRQLTRLSLAEIQTMDNTENVNLNLQTGRVRVDVNPPAGTRTNFTVQSPNATASVRGTSFEFDTQNLTVNEGQVVFTGSFGTAVVVNEGNASFVGTEGVSVSPVEVTTAALAPPPPVGAPEAAAPPSISPVGFGVILEFP